MTVRKSNTKLTVDQIIDRAADVLERDGWITSECALESGGHCAVGAVARAIYPKATVREINDLAYPDDKCWFPIRPADPRHLQALEFLAKRFRKHTDEIPSMVRPISSVVYAVNDNLPDDTDKERRQSSRKIVKLFRNAAKAYRKQQPAA